MVFIKLVKREIKAFLKNPAFIISIVLLLVMFVFIGSVTRTSIEQTQKLVLTSEVGVVLEEETEFTKTLILYLNQSFNGRIKQCSSLVEAVEKYGIGISIPRGFTENSTTGQPIVFLDAMFKVDSFSQSSIQAKAALVDGVVKAFESLIPIVTAQLYGVEQPLQIKVATRYNRVLFYGREVSQQILFGLFVLGSFIPFILGLVMGLNAGYASQLVAYEKVEKAFEMLLAQPIKRSRIVAAKIIGASVATIIFGLVYFGGIFGMIYSSMPIQQEQGVEIGSVFEDMSRELGFDVGLHLAVSFIIPLLLGLFQSGAMGIILGSLSQDERTASVLSTPITLVYIAIAMITMYIGLEVNIYTSILAGFVPLILPAIYLVSLITGSIINLLIPVALNVLITVLLVIVAIMIFNRDIVILGVKIKIGRREAP